MSVPAAAADIDSIYQAPVSQADIYSEPVDVITLDVLAAPGREIHLGAGLYRHGKKIFRAVSDTPVEFRVGGSTAGFADTDGSGLVRLPYLIGQGTGQYLISANLMGGDLFKGSTGYSLLAVVSQNAPLLLVDFDSALFGGISGKFELAGVQRMKPLANAAEALGALQEKYQVVYLTEYEVRDLPKIRRWIHHWKMPKAPILFWNRGEKVLKNDGWKVRELARFLKQWGGVRAAVGGSSSSLYAFRSNNLKTAAIRSKWTREPGTLSDWREVQAKIESQ